MPACSRIRFAKSRKATQCPRQHVVRIERYCMGLAEFERDLHVHVHLENNILFTRACDLEKAA